LFISSDFRNITTTHDMDGSSSSVGINRLQLPHGVLFKDVWSNVKEQPAYLNINVALSPGFEDAARMDEVNNTTLHYGNLAKVIRAAYAQPRDNYAVLETVESNILSLGRRGTRGHAVSYVKPMSVRATECLRHLLTLPPITLGT
jgi:dihydroneopterin aldolase